MNGDDKKVDFSQLEEVKPKVDFDNLEEVKKKPTPSESPLQSGGSASQTTSLNLPNIQQVIAEHPEHPLPLSPDQIQQKYSEDAKNQEDISVIQKQAYDHAVAKNYAASNAVADILLTKDPANVYAHQIKGNNYLHDDKPELAEKEFTQAIAKNPKDPDLYYNRALANFRANKDLTPQNVNDANIYIKAQGGAGDGTIATAKKLSQSYAIAGNDYYANYFRKTAKDIQGAKDKQTEASNLIGFADWSQAKIGQLEDVMAAPLMIPAKMAYEGVKQIAQNIPNPLQPSITDVTEKIPNIVSGATDVAFAGLMSQPAGWVFNATLSAGELVGANDLTEWAFSPISKLLQASGMDESQLNAAQKLVVKWGNLLPFMAVMGGAKGVIDTRKANDIARKLENKEPLNGEEVKDVDKVVSTATPQDAAQSANTAVQFDKIKKDAKTVSEAQQAHPDIHTYRVGKDLWTKDEFLKQAQDVKNYYGEDVPVPQSAVDLFETTDPEVKQQLNELFKKEVHDADQIPKAVEVPRSEQAGATPQVAKGEEAQLQEPAGQGKEKEVAHASDIKSKFIKQFKDKGVPEEQINGAVALMDARAKSWASEEVGRTPDQWYNKIADVRSGEFQSETPIQYQLPDGRKVLAVNMPEVTEGFYSPIEKGLLDIKQDKMSANQWLTQLKGRGVKGDELTYTGLEDMLKANPSKSFTKGELQNWMKDNRIEIKEVVQSGSAKSISDFSHEMFGKSWDELTRIQKIDVENAYSHHVARENIPLPKYGDDPRLQLPGNKENYREVLITLPVPDKPTLSQTEQNELTQFENIRPMNRTPLQNRRMQELYDKKANSTKYKFKSGHFDEPNVLAHLRMNTRTDAEGKKTLFIEELQSDWGQKGKKEGFDQGIDMIKPDDVTILSDKKTYYDDEIGDYRHNVRFKVKGFPDEDGLSYSPKQISDLKKHIAGQYNQPVMRKGMVPPAPFVTSTPLWTKLGLKVALQQAVKEGADKIAWTTGEQQNDRYDLSKQIDGLTWSGNEDRVYIDINGIKGVSGQDITIGVDKKTGIVTSADYGAPETWKGSKLESVIGKDIAAKIMNENNGSLKGEGLKVGGKGMIGFYGSPKEGKLGIVGEVAEGMWGKGSVKTTFIGDKAEEYSGGTKEDIRRLGAQSGGISEQHSIDITPKMREEVERGLPLYQKGEKGIPKGAVETLADGKKVIHALSSPDFSTMVHEIAHVFEDDLTKAEQKAVKDFGGTEPFARGFERYLRDGKAPTKALKSLFEKFKQWLTDIYSKLKGSPIEKKITPEIKQIFDRLLTEIEPRKEGVTFWHTDKESAPKPAQERMDETKWGKIPTTEQTEKINASKKLIGTTENGLRIYEVDGSLIQHEGDKEGIYGDFNLGGNDMAYPNFIPKNEIWIDKNVIGDNRKFTIQHEILERNEMSEGKPYEDESGEKGAHPDALQFEKDLYDGKKEPFKLLDEQGSPVTGFPVTEEKPETFTIDQAIKNAKKKGAQNANAEPSPEKIPVGEQTGSSPEVRERDAKGKETTEEKEEKPKAEVPERLTNQQRVNQAKTTAELASMKDLIRTPEFNKRMEELRKGGVDAWTKNAKKGVDKFLNLGAEGLQSNPLLVLKPFLHTAIDGVKLSIKGEMALDKAIKEQVDKFLQSDFYKGLKEAEKKLFGRKFKDVLNQVFAEADKIPPEPPKNINDFFETEPDPEEKGTIIGDIKAKKNVSNWTAFKDWAGYNFHQLGKIDPESKEAAMKMAGSAAQSSIIMKKAITRIIKDVGTKGWSDLRKAIVESRLRGIRDRWTDMSESILQASDDDIVKAFSKEKGLGDLLSNIQARFGENSINQTALGFLSEEDYNGLRNYLSNVFQNCSENVSHVDFGDEKFEDIIETPQFKKGLNVYKNLIEKPIAENHAQNEGIFSDALGPLDTYYPLIPLESDGKLMGRGKPFKKPINLSNKFATGLAKDYDLSVDALGNKLRRAIKANNKADLITHLEKSGLLQRVKESQDVININGEYMTAKTVDITDPMTIIKDGKKIRLPIGKVAMPEWLYESLKPMLDNEKYNSRTVLGNIFNGITQWSLGGPFEAAFHSANLIGGIVNGTPWAGKDVISKTIGNTPMTKIFTGILNVITQDVSSEKAITHLEDMAKIGLFGDRVGGIAYNWPKWAARDITVFGKKFKPLGIISGEQAREAGMTTIPFADKFHPFGNFAPILYGRRGIDLKARMLMDDICLQINPSATSEQRREFSYQLGNYVKDAQGKLASIIKRNGLSPFYTAGSTFYKNGIKAMLGFNPLPTKGLSMGSKIGLKTAQLLTSGVVGMTGMWVAGYLAMKGKYPWQDKDSRFMQWPIPESVKETKLGKRLFYRRGKWQNVSLDFFNPVLSRGERAFGIPAMYKTAMARGSVGQVIEAGNVQQINSALSPFVSSPPVQFASTSLTGSRIYLTSLRDYRGNPSLQLFRAVKTMKPGIQLPTNIAQATISINPLLSRLSESTGIGFSPDYSKEDYEYLSLFNQFADLAFPRLLKPATSTSQLRKSLSNQRKAIEKATRKKGIPAPPQEPEEPQEPKPPN